MRGPTRTVTAAVGWLVVVAASAAFAWFMIDRAGRQVMEGNRSIAVLASAARPTPTPSASASAPSVRTATRSVTVRGGTVVAACTGSHASLRSATPRDGWRLESPEPARGVLKVQFEAPGENESEVAVACVGGIPTFSTS